MHEKEAGRMSFRPHLILSKDLFKPRGRQMIFQYKSPLYETFNQQSVFITAIGLYLISNKEYKHINLINISNIYIGYNRDCIYKCIYTVGFYCFTSTD